MDAINTIGKVAGSISAILALLTLVLWRPIKNKLRRRKEARDLEHRERKDFERKVLESLESLTEDVTELQRDRLSQAHEHYMEQGWCSPEKKRELCDWHRVYAGKGRNHLSDHYEEDILNLPDKPPSRTQEPNT